MNHILTLEELLHIAIDALARQQMEVSLATLKRCVAEYPDAAQAHYLLGSAYAQLGMTGRAIEELQAALALEPQLELACFQLGLLQMGAGRSGDALATWEALDRLDAEHPLRSFKQGLVHLVAEELAAAEEALLAGIARNAANPALNRDMGGIVARIRAQRAQSGAADAADAAAEPAAPAAHHVGMAAYQDRAA
jgi:tetratricopeptide (TPR) repeat protein